MKAPSDLIREGIFTGVGQFVAFALLTLALSAAVHIATPRRYQAKPCACSGSKTPCPCSGGKP